MSDTIVTVDLVAVSGAGERRPFSLRLARPERRASGMWVCALTLDGLEQSLPPAAGEDALQSLCLALSLATALLRDRMARGESIQYPDGESFPLEAYFGWLGELAPPAS